MRGVGEDMLLSKLGRVPFDEVLAGRVILGSAHAFELFGRTSDWGITRGDGRWPEG